MAQENEASSLTPKVLQEKLHIFIEDRKLYTDILNPQEFNEENFNHKTRGLVAGACATAISYYSINQLLQTYFPNQYQIAFPPAAWVDTDLKADLLIYGKADQNGTRFVEASSEFYRSSRRHHTSTRSCAAGLRPRTATPTAIPDRYPSRHRTRRSPMAPNEVA